MFKLINRAARAPLSYIADLRKITCKGYLMLHTNFSPAYPINIFFSLAATLALSFFIIYYLFTVHSQDQCFVDVRTGSYIISILYPIETILFFICLTGSIALSKSSCWKVTWLVLLGPVLSGFGFGQLAFILICLLGAGNENAFNVLQILKNKSFIEAMIYLYISFLLLYFILVPSFRFLYRRQSQDKQEERERRKTTESKARKSMDNKKQLTDNEGEDVLQFHQETSCCNRFVCILYYFLLILFAIAVIFIAIIKVLGPFLFTYVWIEIGKSYQSSQDQNLKTLLALSLLAYFGPLGILIITLGIQRIRRLATKKQSFQEKENDVNRDTKTIDLSDGVKVHMEDQFSYGQADKQKRDREMSFRKSVDEPTDERRASLSFPKRSIRDEFL